MTTPKKTKDDIARHSFALREAIVAASDATLQKPITMAKETMFPAVQEACASAIHLVLSDQAARLESRVAKLEQKLAHTGCFVGAYNDELTTQNAPLPSGRFVGEGMQNVPLPIAPFIMKQYRFVRTQSSIKPEEDEVHDDKNLFGSA